MADLTAQAREMASIISAKKTEAAKAWSELDSLRQSARKEGVDFASNPDAFDKLDAAGKQYDVIRDEVAGLEAKRARLLELAVDGQGFDAPSAKGRPRTAGATFTGSDAYAEMKARASQGDSLPLGASSAVKVMSREEVKTLVSVTVSAGTAALANAPVEDRLSLVVAKPLASLDFLSVIGTGTTDSDQVSWLEETTYTNAAAETHEYNDSPESEVLFTERTSDVREVTHFIPVTRRALADVAFIESWINDRLVDGVRRRLQTQVLNGNGTAPNLRGIYNTSGIGTIDRSTTGLSMTDSLHRCITTIRTNAFVEPDFIGIHPEDWEAIRLVRGDATTYSGATAVAGYGSYIYGDPAGNGPATLWGIPVIVHAAFTSGSPLVGRGADASLFVREGLSVAASDSHSDFFIKRRVAILASLRAAFAVTQPASFARSVA